MRTICLLFICSFFFSPCLAQYGKYAPSAENPSHHPMRYVRINVHVVRNDDGSGNFNNEEGLAYVRHLVAISNIELMKNAKMNLPKGNNTPVLPIGYQYVLTGEEGVEGDEGIYFIDDTELNDFNSLDHRNMADGRIYQKYAKGKERILNVFLMENNDSTDYTTRGIGMPYWVKVGSCYASAKKRNRGTWALRGLFNHEIGHSLGLAHTWGGYDACDDTPTHPNCWNHGSGQCELGSNNMMDYNAHQNAMSPCQIGLVHFRMSQFNANSRKFLLENWSTYKADSTVRVQANDSVAWMMHKEFEGDIVVGRNATLIIDYQVALPEGAKIILKKNAKIIIGKAGSITNISGGEWGGFRIWGWKIFGSKRLEKSVIMKENKLKNVSLESWQSDALNINTDGQTEL